MKKSEKDALKKAFNIPEPKHKNSFVSSYNEMLKKNERKFNIPVFFRWTSTAVFAALIIGLWGNLSQNTDFRDKFTQDTPQIITETTTTSITTVTETNDINTIITSSVVSQTDKMTQTQITSQTSKKSESSVISTSITSTSHTESKNNTVTEKTEISRITEPAPTTSTDKITTFRTTHATETATTNTDSPTLNVTTTVKNTTQKTEITSTTSRRTTIVTKTELNNEPVPDVTTTVEYTDLPPMVPSTTTEDEQDIVTTTQTDAQFPSTDNPMYFGNNYIVTPSANYKKSANIIDINKILDSNDSKEPNDNVITFQNLFNNSDYIILGVIDEIIYTEVNGMPYTQENITIYSVYKGTELIPMDKISVYITGGYMPIQNFADMNGIDINYPDNYSVYDSGGNKGTQNVGDMLLFCIKDSKNPMPDGAFILTEQTDISVFRYEHKEYISLGNENFRFKINDLLNI